MTLDIAETDLVRWHNEIGRAQNLDRPCLWHDALKKASWYWEAAIVAAYPLRDGTPCNSCVVFPTEKLPRKKKDRINHLRRLKLEPDMVSKESSPKQPFKNKTKSQPHPFFFWLFWAAKPAGCVVKFLVRFDWNFIWRLKSPMWKLTVQKLDV